MKNQNHINTLTATQMAELASQHMDVMEKSIAAFNRKWGNLLSSNECKDLLTEAYLDACDGVDTYDSEKGGIRGWLSTVAHNAACSYMKRKLREVRLDLDIKQDTDDEDQPTAASTRLSRSERDQLLFSQWNSCEEAFSFEDRRKVRLQRECWMEAFHALSDNDQLLLYMRHDLDIPETEMARQRQMSYGALRVALSRAHDRFEAELEARHFKEIDEWTSRYFHEDNDGIPDWGDDEDETFFGGRSETNG